MARDDTPSQKPLLDKLGVRHGARVALVGWDRAGDGGAFEKLLAERTDDVSRTPDGGAPVDLVFLYATELRAVERMASLKSRIRPDGAIWVVRVKGAARAFSDVDLIEAGLRTGLVDNKIASFSDTLSAMRFVIRLKDR